jgi:conjugal transfer mating pair stabilization protein TraG
MSWEIYTFGGGQYLYQVFNGIASLTSGDNYLNLVSMSGLLGLAWVLIQVAFNLNFKSAVNWFVSFILIYNVLFLPKASVLINDQLDRTPYSAVDNVPLALAVFASLSSTIGKDLTEGFEMAFTTPDDLKYHKNGMLFGSKLMQMSASIQITDSNFASSINSFMKQCVFYDILLGRYTLEEMKTADDLWKFLTVENQAAQARSFSLRTATDSKILTCIDGAVELNKVWSEQISKSGDIFSQLFFSNVPKDQAKKLLLQYLPVSYDSLLGISKGATDIIRQSMLINAVDTAATDFSNTGTSANIYTTVRSNIQTKAAFNASHRQAEEWVPVLKIVLEVLFYGAFPLVFLMCLLPIGGQVLKGYFATFIWLQAWAPLYALMNLVMHTYYANKTVAKAAGYGMSVVSRSGILAVQQDAAVMAGYLLWFVPFIAAGLAKGMISVTGLATSMLAVPQSAANAAANEVATGNISLGNSSLDNSSHSNISSNKINDSTFFDGARIQAVNSVGGMSTVNPDGRVVYDQSGAVSRIPNMQAFSSTTTSQSNSETVGLLNNMGENTAQSAAYAKSKSIDQMAQHMANHNINEGHGIKFTDHASADVKQSYQEIESVAQNLSKAHGIDKATALSMALGLNADAKLPIGAGLKAISGGSKGIGDLFSAGANISGTGSFDVRSSENYGEGENINNSKQLDHHRSVVFNAIKDGSIDFSDSHGNSLNESISQGLQESARYEMQSRVYFDVAKTMGEQSQYEERRSLSITQDDIPMIIEKGKHVRGIDGQELGEHGVLRMLSSPASAKQLVENIMQPGTITIKNNFSHDRERLQVGNLQEDYLDKAENIESMRDNMGGYDNSAVKSGFDKSTEGKIIDNSALKPQVEGKIQAQQVEIKNVELDKAEVGKQVKDKLEDGAFITVAKSVLPEFLGGSSSEKPKSNFDDNNDK